MRSACRPGFCWHDCIMSTSACCLDVLAYFLHVCHFLSRILVCMSGYARFNTRLSVWTRRCQLVICLCFCSIRPPRTEMKRCLTNVRGSSGWCMYWYLCIHGFSNAVHSTVGCSICLLSVDIYISLHSSTFGTCFPVGVALNRFAEMV